jgi:gamma-glutamyltranspeptidase
LNLIEFGLDPQEAVEAPRFYSYVPEFWFPIGLQPGPDACGGRITVDVLDALRQRGHKVEAYRIGGRSCL